MTSNIRMPKIRPTAFLQFVANACLHRSIKVGSGKIYNVFLFAVLDGSGCAPPPRKQEISNIK